MTAKFQIDYTNSRGEHHTLTLITTEEPVSMEDVARRVHVLAEMFDKLQRQIVQIQKFETSVHAMDVPERTDDPTEAGNIVRIK
jgi:hypothetical protein